MHLILDLGPMELLSEDENILKYAFLNLFLEHRNFEIYVEITFYLFFIDTFGLHLIGLLLIH